MINFKSIDITSFKSIYHCFLDFDELNDGLYFIEGINNTNNFANSNGAGKSTLVESIMFALFGTVDGLYVKQDTYQNNKTNIPLKVTLKLSIQDIDYKIERTLKSFKIFDKNNKDISEQTKTDTEKKFQNILGITKSEFLSFTYLSQNGTGSFLSKTPAEKLNCIKDFVFGEELQSIQNKLDVLDKDTKDKINKIKSNISVFQGQIFAFKEILSKQENTDIDDNLIKNDNEKREREIELNNLKSKEKEYNDIRQSLNLSKREQKDLYNTFNSLKEDYNKIKQDKICPTCGGRLWDLDLQVKYKSKLLDIREEYRKLSELNREKEEKLNNISIENIREKIKYINREIIKYEENSKNKDIDYKDIEKSIDILEDKKEKLNLELELLNQKQIQLIQLIKYFKTTFIQNIQQKFLQEIQNYLNLYCSQVFEDMEFKVIFTNNSLELTLNDYPYSYFSGGERQRIDFLFIFAIKVVLDNFTNKCTNLFICDESLSGQDGLALDKCINIIKDLSESEKIKTILISHDDIVKQQNNKIIIERNENNTKLVII